MCKWSKVETVPLLYNNVFGISFAMHQLDSAHATYSSK